MSWGSGLFKPNEANRQDLYVNCKMGGVKLLDYTWKWGVLYKFFAKSYRNLLIRSELTSLIKKKCILHVENRLCHKVF